jgi:hypothetical protein
LSDIESLVIFAGIHRKEFGFYRMLSKRFPYAIYYDVNDDVASVAVENSLGIKILKNRFVGWVRHAWLH